MINTIIFDFGDVFLNLKRNQSKSAFDALGLNIADNEVQQLNFAFETGEITEPAFLESLNSLIPNASVQSIRKAWNAVIGDFPLYRLEFLQMLSQRFRLFLLTNTDSIHISHFEETAGISFARDFYQCFEKVYYSFELGMRKPEKPIFEYLIRQHELSPKRTLFVDDRADNIDTAKSLGLNVWHLQPENEDVVHLFEKKIIAQ